MTTKTSLKSKIDAIYAEIDKHTDLSPAQRATMRRKIGGILEAALEEAHNQVPGLSKTHREANAKHA